MRGIVFCVTLSLILCYYSVNGSGYFLKPLSRSSMWRFTGGLSYANQINVNRDDLNLNCGGVHTMGGDLTGKCGACGDPVNGPKQNEAGGLYASGHPTAVYNEGSIINVTVFVQNRKNGGFFEFYLCGSDVTTAVSEVCFQNHPLKLANSQETSIPIKDVDGEITVPLQLPSALTCDHCVMRWVWVTANEYRCDPTGLCGLGYWDQTTWVNCADVMIVRRGSLFPPTFEYPNYQSLYDSMDGSSTTIPPLTKEPIQGSSTTAATKIPVITVQTVSPVTGSTAKPPIATTEKLVGPIIAGGGGLAAGLGSWFPFLPIAGLGGLAYWNYRKNSAYPEPLMFNYSPIPVSYSPLPVFGGPVYMPTTELVIERHYRIPKKDSSYTSYGRTGYGDNNPGYSTYGNNYNGNSGYSNYGSNGNNNYGSSGYDNYGNNNYGSSGYDNYGNNNYGSSGYDNYGNNNYGSSGYGNNGNNNYGSSGYGNNGNNNYDSSGYGNYDNSGYLNYDSNGYNNAYGK